LPLKIICVFLNVALVFFFTASADCQDLSVKFHTEPLPAQIGPFEEAVKFSLVVNDNTGKPVERGEIAIALDAPSASSFLSTDFPLIQGTRLLEMRLPLTEGQSEWRQLLPIRGVYRLAIAVSAGDGRVAQKNFELTVAENWQKWLWLGLFCAALFLVGFVAGRVFTGSRRAKAMLLIGLALICRQVAAPHEAARAAQGETPTAALDIEPATVGKLTRVRWHGISPGSKLQSLAIIHLEKHKTVLALEKLAIEKEFSFSFHFPDGAQYLIQTAAETPDSGQERAEQRISVAGIEPSLGTQMPSLILFLTVIALGLGAGRFSKRSSQKLVK
jgi:hypothetical protein